MTIHVDMAQQADFLAAATGIDPDEALGVLTRLRLLALHRDPETGWLGVTSDEHAARLLRRDPAFVDALRSEGIIDADFKLTGWDFGETGLARLRAARKAGKASAEKRRRRKIAADGFSDLHAVGDD